MNTITDILTAAQKDIASLSAYKDNKYFMLFMETAYIPDKRMVLPEGTPPYKKNNQHEQQLRGSFWQIARRMDVFTRTDLNKGRQEFIFIQALESLPDGEAKILLAAKDQELHKLFKGITLAALVKSGFFPVGTK